MYFDMKAVGNRICQLRTTRNISQIEMAEILNLSRSHYSHIEIGDRPGTVEFLIDVAVYFDVSLDFLILGREYLPAGVRTSIQEAIDILSGI